MRPRSSRRLSATRRGAPRVAGSSAAVGSCCSLSRSSRIACLRRRASSRRDRPDLGGQCRWDPLLQAAELDEAVASAPTSRWPAGWLRSCFGRRPEVVAAADPSSTGAGAGLFLAQVAHAHGGAAVLADRDGWALLALGGALVAVHTRFPHCPRGDGRRFRSRCARIFSLACVRSRRSVSGFAVQMSAKPACSSCS